MKIKTHGLTLVELIVVLTILSLVAGVAMTASEGFVDQSRYESTQHSLRNLEDAILGPANLRQPDGSPWISGFVADIGRLPKIHLENSADPELHPEKRLRELWEPLLFDNTTFPPFGIQIALGDTDIRLPAGWRGPYLRFAPGQNVIRDGWNYELRGFLADGVTENTSNGALVEIIRSWGADHQDDNLLAPAGPYDKDLEIAIHRTITPLQMPRQLGTIPVRINAEFSFDPKGAESGDFLVLRLYGPVDGIVKTIEQKNSPISVLFDASGNPISVPFSFDNVSIGHRAIRIYQVHAMPENWDELITSAVRKSAVIPISVIAGGLPEISIELK